MNYSTEEIRNREKQVQQLAERDGKTIYLVSYAGSVDEALTYNNQLYHQLQSLKQEQKITNFSSIGGVVLSTSVQNERIKHWSDFWTDPKKIRYSRFYSANRLNMVSKPRVLTGFMPS